MRWPVMMARSDLVKRMEKGLDICSIREIDRRRNHVLRYILMHSKHEPSSLGFRMKLQKTLTFQLYFYLINVIIGNIWSYVGQFYPGLQQCKGKGPAQYLVWGDMNIRGRPANERAKLPSEERCNMLTGSGTASEDYGHLGTLVRGAWLACWSLGTVPRTIIQRHKGENIQQKVVVYNSKYLVMLSPPH